MAHLYLFFSGTGNTKYVLKRFIKERNQEDVVLQSIEHNDFNYDEAIGNANEITIGYPIYGGIMPSNMKEFLQKYKSKFYKKNLNVIITQMYFSGDGAALACRILQSTKPTILQTIHINMPNNITDLKIFPAQSLKDSSSVIRKADENIEQIVKKINQGKTYKMGRRWYSRVTGFFAQRLYFIPAHEFLKKRIKINQEKCIHCNKCVTLCPTDNLIISNDSIVSLNQCNLCYRCINSCPTKAISLFTKKSPTVQFIHDDFN